MHDYPNTSLYALRFIFVGILIIASLFLLSFILSSLETSSAQARSAETSANIFDADAYDNPNVVTSGAAAATKDLGQAIDSTEKAIISGTQSASSAVSRNSKLVARSVQSGVIAAARGVGSGLSAAGRTVGSGIRFTLSIPGNVLGFISNTQVLSSVIRPSEHAEVPIIDPDSPELHAALAALPPAKSSSNTKVQSGSGPAWPMRGRVTADFGVPHWPYQHTHTGIDISDGRASGITPIKPFRPGRVINTVYSNYGLGNHVIVDHGNGVTSVYAHFSSISVKKGQHVGMDTTLGRAGSTGLSTGTHLHFEIRVHGKAANPRQFIDGNP